MVACTNGDGSLPPPPRDAASVRDPRLCKHVHDNVHGNIFLDPVISSTITRFIFRISCFSSCIEFYSLKESFYYVTMLISFLCFSFWLFGFAVELEVHRYWAVSEVKKLFVTLLVRSLRQSFRVCLFVDFGFGFGLLHLQASRVETTRWVNIRLVSVWIRLSVCEIVLGWTLLFEIDLG